MGKNLRRREEAEIKELKRLVMSYQDFQQASFIASYILEKELPDKAVRLKGKRGYHAMLLWRAMNCAMVVSYCRPFSGNDKRSPKPIPDFPKRFLGILTKKGREFHDLAMQDRNTVIAHSDSAAWDLQLAFSERPDKTKQLWMQHNDTNAPLVTEGIEQLKKNCEKFRDRIMEERIRLEKDIAEMLPTSNDSKELLDFMNQ